MMPTRTRLRLAQAFVLTVPGAPVLYYGDEFGLPGVGDPDNRRPMRFGGRTSSSRRRRKPSVGWGGCAAACPPCAGGRDAAAPGRAPQLSARCRRRGARPWWCSTGQPARPWWFCPSARWRAMA
ncbi:MAG: hypothetical protein R3F43_23360 [bacterium]